MGTTDRLVALQEWLGEGPIVGFRAPPWAAPLKWKVVREAPARLAGRFVALDLSRDEAAVRALFARASKWAATSLLVVGFRVASSGAAMLDVLAGKSAPAEPRWHVHELEALAAEFGLAVTSRQTFVEPHEGLAGHTAHSLRALFRQLNEATDEDYVLLAFSSRSASVVPARRTLAPGVVSVVIRNHTLARASLLDQALFSLATQTHRGLEIILVSQSMEPDARTSLERLLARHQALGGYSFKVILCPSSEDIRAKLGNLGIAAATGQYLAFLDDDDVVYPAHYSALIDALTKSPDHAWAFAPVCRAFFEATADQGLYCTRKETYPRGETLELARLFHENYVPNHSFLIDRSRIGAFKVAFEESLTKGEDHALLMRLLAVFRPLAVGGPPTVEYRIRNDGSNTVPHEGLTPEAAAALQQQWQMAHDVKSRLTGSLQVLVTRAELVGEVLRGLVVAERPAPDELRYRLVDAANAVLKKGLPLIHASLKGTLGSRVSKK